MSKNKGKTYSYRKEALETTLKKRKECSTKALETVEKLIEKNVTEEMLLHNIHFINQSSYQDVIDERSIMNICGYPICDNELRNIPKQQYRITRTNGTLLLYDTTERKKFCSNMCYKSSKYLKDQLPSSPLWLMQPSDTESIRLIPFDCRFGGSFGEQINFTFKNSHELDQSSQHQQQHSVPVNKEKSNSVKNEKLSEKNDCDIIGLTNNNNHDGNKKNKINNDDKILAHEENAVNDNEKCNDAVEQKISSLSPNTSSCNNKYFIDVKNTLQSSCTIEAATAIIEEISKEVCDNNSKITDNNNVNINTKSESLPENERVINFITSTCNSTNVSNTSNASSGFSEHNNVINEPHRSTINKSNNHDEYKKEKQCDNGTLADDNNSLLIQLCNKGLQNTDDRNKLTTDNTNKYGTEKNKIKKTKHKKSKVTNDISPMLAAVLRTEQCIREWVSLDTLFFLLGEDKFKNLIEETCGLEKFQGLTMQSSMQDPVIYERYLAICKKLNLLELNESKFDHNVKNENTSNVVGPQKPIPDFERLKEEAKEMEIKVKSFYRGDKQVQFADNVIDNDKIDKEPVTIPLVDQHAQKALRRRIILDNLNRVLPDLLRTLGLSKYSGNITGDVKRLVETFTLSAHNITFRPAEWNFVAIIIIKLLSVRDEILNQTLLMERADKYLTLMLMSYEQDSGYLNRLLTWLLYEHTLFNV
ncbi:putative RNA polymerase II subunit B1 CTD phosphatase RPAP2 [Lycorma delicatula]|uniref:putative RNA polymerase II subunit B1 CTD phosphatase RPAP2 n=1 Tax=Lycorma delicatula TaxID=130591 RepID=UPI003F510845